MPGTHYDDKGKIFTDVVTKEMVYSVIQTVTHQVRGIVHVRPGERLKDEMNTTAEQFLAVTDAKILGPAGDELFQCEFLALNRDHIVWLLPMDEMKERPSDQSAGEA